MSTPYKKVSSSLSSQNNLKVQVLDPTTRGSYFIFLF